MTLAIRRGLSYPSTRRLITRGRSVRTMLLQGAGEEEFTRFVKGRAHYYGWRGYHLRDSEGVIESVHTLRLDDFCDGLGVPDWRFWNEGLGQTFDAELKGASGVLSKYQKALIASLRKTGIAVFVWWPKDADIVERIFRYGYRQEDLCQT